MTEFKYGIRYKQTRVTKILLKRKHVHMTNTFVQVCTYKNTNIYQRKNNKCNL